LIWGGYPGQDGGTALFDIITGKQGPAGRLPITQYPADYVDQVPITDMSLRPGTGNPGRTYKWYNQTPVVEFGTGLHYTSFTFDWASGTNVTSFDIQELVGNSTDWDQLETQIFNTYELDVANTGNFTSDYVALLFLQSTAGPAPYPSKSLVSYNRVHSVRHGSSSTTTLPVTLGSLARVDESGNTVLYPGEYSLLVDVPQQLSFNFTLTGKAATLEQWPQE
jgi:beta-D-xylosidase 4